MNRLETIRDSLDKLDSALISILAERFQLTDEVGVFKAENNLPSIDQERERQQFARIKQLADVHGLEPEIAAKILRLIIDEVVKKHERIKQKNG
ncbi:MAG: chorismate mutase [Candidatus Electrothrix sp. AUS4]|nr:chorismate mutase [Candidatus Electrothrix sp. AUS4]